MKSDVLFQRRQYEFIARVVREHGDTQWYRLHWADTWADELAKTNPRFDRARFIAACLQPGDSWENFP